MFSSVTLLPASMIHRSLMLLQKRDTGTGKSHHHRHKSHRDKNDQQTGKNDRQTGSASRNVRTRFLCVVNELHINQNMYSPLDNWRNFMPPNRREHYTGETKGRIIRYEDGIVTVLDENDPYQWWRDEPETEYAPHGPGTIYRLNYNETTGEVELPSRARVYKQCTIFNSGRHLPYAIRDYDMSSEDAYSKGDVYCLPLLFRAMNLEAGISRAGTEGHKVVTGRKPSWIPSLVNPSYKLEGANWPLEGDCGRSRGLSGNLALVLGMMALTGPIGSPTAVFEREDWQNRLWNPAERTPNPDSRKFIIPGSPILECGIDML